MLAWNEGKLMGSLGLRPPTSRHLYFEQQVLDVQVRSVFSQQTPQQRATVPPNLGNTSCRAATVSRIVVFTFNGCQSQLQPQLWAWHK